ncbi:MAG: signal peptidase I [Patiriisocius sp.]|jgi:signal peptidase I
MSINFPLILVLGTAFSGLVWLIDYLVLRPKRSAAAELVKSDAEKETALKEPVVVEYSISFFPVLAVVLVLRSFVAEPFQIPTGSMIPTLLVGDFIVVNKFAYGLRLPVLGTKIVDVGMPKNGEVMVFIPPHEDEYFIKRVVGIPGDIIRYENKQIFVNGEAQPQKFIAALPPGRPRYQVLEETLGGTTHRIHRDIYNDSSSTEWIIPEGKYFMMGDNRDQSSDSRYWGLVSEDKIVGKAFAIWLQKDPGFQIPGFSRNGWIE